MPYLVLVVSLRSLISVLMLSRIYAEHIFFLLSNVAQQSTKYGMPNGKVLLERSVRKLRGNEERRRDNAFKYDIPTRPNLHLVKERWFCLHGLLVSEFLYLLVG